MREAATIQRETLLEAYRDAIPLLAMNADEIKHYRDYVLDVDQDFYMRAELVNGLRIYTARIHNRLVGYAIYLVRTNGHYKAILQAAQDVLYVVPTARGAFLGLRLVRFADQALKAEGVHVVTQHQKLAHPALGAVLRRAGYEHVENMWSKRLDQEASSE